LAKTKGQTGMYESAADRAERERQANMGFTGNLIGTGATALAMCDERFKEDIVPTEGDELKDMLDKLTISSFEYKDPSMGEGKFYGPMAQDLEKSKVGRTMVEEDPAGRKFIDYGGRGQGVMLGILKNLSDRLERVEGARG
jgi:hypothetical protein